MFTLIHLLNAIMIWPMFPGSKVNSRYLLNLDELMIDDWWIDDLTSAKLDHTFKTHGCSENTCAAY